jgi:hypothetical protein
VDEIGRLCSRHEDEKNALSGFTTKIVGKLEKKRHLAT